MVFDLFNNRQPSPNQQQSTTPKPTINRSSKTYEDKLAKEQYDLFTSRDVVEHFERHYTLATGKKKDWNVAHAVKQVEELFQQEFSADTLTLYIEFIFLSDQTCIDKEKAGIGTFKIDKFVDYIEANLEAYENGESIVKKENKKDFETTIDTHKEWSRDKKGRVKFELNRFF